MTLLAAGLFAVLLGLALMSRVRPIAPLTRGVERVLEFFGVAPAEPELATGDLLGAAGAGGFVFLFFAERSGWSLDGVLVIDLALSAFGLGLALTWLIVRMTTEPGDPWGEDEGAPRELFTEPDPRQQDPSSSDPS